MDFDTDIVEQDPDAARDDFIFETTDWDRIDWHKPAGAIGYSMSRAELSTPCERAGCTCPWSILPTGTTVIARGLRGVVTDYPESWERYPGWVAVEFAMTGNISMTRIADIEEV